MDEEEPMETDDNPSQVTTGTGHFMASDKNSLQENASDSDVQRDLYSSPSNDSTAPQENLHINPRRGSHYNDKMGHDTSVIIKQPKSIQAAVSRPIEEAGRPPHIVWHSQVTTGTGQFMASDKNSLQENASDSDVQTDLYSSPSNDSTAPQENLHSNPRRGSHPNDKMNDTAKIMIKVEWTKDIPPKWTTMLHKALQSWFNEKLPNEKLEVVSLNTVSEDSLMIQVEITPKRGLNALKMKGTGNLTFKDMKEQVTVHFLDEMKSLDEHKVKITGEAATGRDTGKKKEPSMVEFQGSQESSGLTVPVPLFWYLTQACRKELNQIENEFGVKINAEVSVSITGQSEKIRNDSVQKAAQRFTDLVQKNTQSMETITIPPAQMESDIMKETVHHTQIEEAKIVLDMSADAYLVFAPKEFTSMLQKRMNPSDTSYAYNYKTSQENFGTLGMDIKDSPNTLVMDETHWELVKKTFGTKLYDIEKKYGVTFSADRYQDSMKVRVQNTGLLVNLETHALRALTHLYQKVAMSTVTCTPKGADCADVVAHAVKRLRPQDCYVVSREKYGSWKLVGLRKHLLHTIAAMEMEAKTALFDNATKQSLGYSEFLAYGWRPQGAGEDGQANGAVLKGQTEAHPSASSRLEKNSKEEDYCPICMDTFNDETKLQCGHEFCRECLNRSVKSMGEICPVCKKIFGKLIGNQPNGTMTDHVIKSRLSGFEDCGTIVINYSIPSGFQTENHPNPGQPFSGVNRTAYLPDNEEGRQVLGLLRTAFKQKLVFTVGTSTTTGVNNTVTWNDIHHKTNMQGGPGCFGYPDADYLKRVRAELKAKGVE